MIKLIAIGLGMLIAFNIFNGLYQRAKIQSLSEEINYQSEASSRELGQFISKQELKNNELDELTRKSNAQDALDKD